MTKNQFENFDEKWAIRLREVRIRVFGTLENASVQIGLSAEVLNLSETQPSLIPVCDLLRIIQFYGIPQNDLFDFCEMTLMGKVASEHF